MMRALILAAGRGSRLGALTAEQPKCLTPLAGRPLFDWQIAALTAAGVTEIGVGTGYCGEMLARPGLTRFDNPRWAQTNMVATLAGADAWLSRAPCLVSYSDIAYAPSAAAALVACPADLAMAYSPDPDWLELWRARFDDPLADAESFQTDAVGRVIDIGRRVTRYEEIAGQYMGLLRFTPAGWAQVKAYLDALGPAAVDKLDMTGLLSRLIAQGVILQGVPAPGAWIEVDGPTDLALGEQLVAAGKLRFPA